MVSFTRALPYAYGVAFNKVIKREIHSRGTVPVLVQPAPVVHHQILHLGAQLRINDISGHGVGVRVNVCHRDNH